jgi:flagella basal body P-ring formation protein FlgA
MFFAPFAAAVCLTLPPGAANITAADLHLEGVAPETVLSFAPAPGLQRVFHVPELRQIAARFQLSQTFDSDICVERGTASLDQAKVLAAMQKELPEAKIEILEVSKQTAPEGEIVFHRAGLRNTTTNGAIWYGSIRYAPNRDFSIWAKVMVTTTSTHVVAVSDLTPGKPVAPEQVAVETVDEFPSAQPLAQSINDVVGRYPKSLIRAGAPIRRDALETPKDVRQGEMVEVDVLSGNARLKLQARAEASGSIGDRIPVLNTESARRFQAIIESKGKVSVDATVRQ